MFNLDKGGSYRPVSQPHIKRFYHKMNDWCSLISLKMTQFTLIKPWRMSYLGPLGRGSHFRGCLGGDWEGWAASCVVFICCNGGEDGHFCGIIIPSLYRAHTQTPSDNFPKRKLSASWRIFLTGNWRILPLSPTGAFTYCLDSWLQFSYSSTFTFKLILENIQYTGAGTTIYNVKWASKLKCCKDKGDIKRLGRLRPLPLVRGNK